MGGSISQLPQPGTAVLPWFAIVFRKFDKIKLVNSDAAVQQAVRSAVVKYWPEGIQNESMDLGAYEFKFRGYPFAEHTVKSDALNIKRTACFMLSNLQSIGWELVVTSDLSRTQDLSTWFFQFNPALVSPSLVKPMVCVSLSRYDKLQLINGPDWLYGILRSAIGPFVQHQEAVHSGVGNGLKDYIVQIAGFPWQNRVLAEGLKARRILLSMFAQFGANKLKYAGSVNVKGAADSMFFQVDEDAPPDTKFAMLSLNSVDKLRLVDVTEPALSEVRKCIEKYWPKGLQHQKILPEYGAVELKLSGCPWHSYGDEAAAARFLLTVILQTLLANGWAVVCSLDISRNLNDKGIYILRDCAPASMAHVCLAPEDSDKIRLLNAPDNVHALVNQCIYGNWAYGVQRERAVFGGHEWKLKGAPWHPYSGNEYAHARQLVCVILHGLSQMGWRVIASADVSSRWHKTENREYPLDVHSLFFAETSVPSRAASALSLSPSQRKAPQPQPPTYDKAMLEPK